MDELPTGSVTTWVKLAVSWTDFSSVEFLLVETVT
ncbi:hypothetical protein PC118_g23793 [Phytophthora cactorum]|uniref:Uncharacterized protein n=1 Tax=Phytophthora cactorum TaxID=29920 RepID=A0A8T1EU24_9STRA|nr:hypothetical protein PC111_g8318 [Phytophthora cactorum]KAG2957900.1 hypothetical protein PC118_g23793 [Phytophthora cactorum]